MLANEHLCRSVWLYEEIHCLILEGTALDKNFIRTPFQAFLHQGYQRVCGAKVINLHTVNSSIVYSVVLKLVRPTPKKFLKTKQPVTAYLNCLRRLNIL